MNPTPEFMEAIKRHRRLVDTLGMDHPDTMRAMMLAMDFKPLSEAEQARVKMRWEERVSGTPNALFRRIDVRVLDARGERTLATLSGFAVRPLR